MNKELVDFIELCLADDLISEKERKVIFKKAKELGVSEDECDILIDSLSQKNNNSKNKIQAKPSIEKRDFKKKLAKSIPPAKLDMENKLREEIAKLNTGIENSNKEKEITISKINDSFKILNNKRDSLKDEFQTYKSNFNKDLKKHINSLFNGIENDLSNKFGQTSIILDDSKKYNANNLDTKSLNKVLSDQVKWDSSALNNKNHKRMLIFYFIGYGGLSISIIFMLFAVYSVDFWAYMFWACLGITFIGKHFKSKKQANTMNFSNDDVLSVASKHIKKNKSRIDDLKNMRKIISQAEPLFKYSRSIHARQ